MRHTVPETVALSPELRGRDVSEDSDPGDVLCLAIDIGGTKMAAAIVDAAGTIHARSRVDTPASDDPETVFAAVLEAASAATATTPRDPIVCGVGCGGPMTPGGAEVSPLHIGSWKSFRLRDRLAEALGLPVHIDNDAKALALGEGWLGAARGLDDYIGMVVSTGIGGGIVLDGRLLDGHSANAGHIGHVVVEPAGRNCFCGGRGCLEAEASGRAIAEITGRPAHEATAAVMQRTGTLVGRAIASVANLLDVPLTVIGGSVALGFGEPFFEAARAELAARARLSYSTATRLLPAALGEDAPLLGAAAVGWRGVGGIPGVVM